MILSFGGGGVGGRINCSIMVVVLFCGHSTLTRSACASRSSSFLRRHHHHQHHHHHAFTPTTCCSTTMKRFWRKQQHFQKPPSFYHHHHHHHPVQMPSSLSKTRRRLTFCSTSSTNKATYTVSDDIYKIEPIVPSLTATSAAATTTATITNAATTSHFCFPIFYNDVYEVILPKNHRFPMQKYAKVRRLVQERVAALQQQVQEQQQQQQHEQHQVYCNFYISPLATVEELTTTHCANYVNRFLSGNLTLQEIRNVGFPWSREGVYRALSSVGGTIAAACAVCEQLLQQQLQQQTKNPTALLPCCWSAHVAGGTHHAFYNYGEGFCIFSDIAVASNVVLQRYPNLVKRILIIDLDVHQGNGNAVLFQNDSRVYTFSMHCQDNYFSTKQTSDLDIELPCGCSDETFLGTIHYWLKRLEMENNKQEKNKFDMIFFQAGVDVLECDRLGRMDLTAAGVAKRNEMVFTFANKLNVPLVITMGGGYPAARSQRDNNEDDDDEHDVLLSSKQQDDINDNNNININNDDSWAPIIEAHANVYIQAYQYLVSRQKENR